MARIELRHTNIVIRDGLAGSADVNQPIVPPGSGDTTLALANVLLNTDVPNRVPVGARFTVDGEAADTVHIVTGRTPTSTGPTTQITFTPPLGAGSYSGTGQGIAGDVTTTTEGGGVGDDDEVQEIAPYVNEVTGGTFTLTIHLNGEDPFTTAPIAYDANAAAIQGAINSAATTAAIMGWTNDDIVVTGGPLTDDPVVLTFSGASVDETDHDLTEIDGSELEAVVGEAELTFQPQEIDIKIGDGDLRYTEADEYLYDLDRGELDTVRKGDDQPMQVVLNFVYEHITTGTDEVIAPMDAIKRRGAAAEWVSASADKCEPYAVDLVVRDERPCVTGQKEITTFPDFRADQKEISLRDANIAVTGRCNATEPIVQRV